MFRSIRNGSYLKKNLHIVLAKRGLLHAYDRIKKEE